MGVWELYAQGNLLDAADPNLGNEYEAGEMEKVLKLGLFCSQIEADRRLGIRQVCQILEDEAHLPDVQTGSFNVKVMGSFGYAATANPNDKILEEMSSRRQSNEELNSTPFSAPR